MLAPPLNDNLKYHAFFLYHNNDRDWVHNVIEKLESPTLGFKCCCHERDLNMSLSQVRKPLDQKYSSCRVRCGGPEGLSHLILKPVSEQQEVSS